VGIKAVSEMLLDRTTRTAELFYGRIWYEKAFAETE
jgi:hypothetical protein